VSFSLAVLRCQERLNQVPCDRWADGATTHAQDVHVVVFNPLPGREVIVDQRGAAAWNLVSANGSPHAAAANGNTTRYLAERHGLGQRSDVVGVIIVGFEFVSSEIDYFVARATKLGSGRRVIDAEWVQLNLARVHAKAEFLKLLNWRIAAEGGPGPGPAAASATKVFGTEFATEAYRLLMEVLGANAAVRDGSPGAVLAGRVERMHRSALILTFGGGTNEVQRDIIAAAGLGLPVARRNQ